MCTTAISFTRQRPVGRWTTVIFGRSFCRGISKQYWTQSAAEPGTAFVPCGNVDLEVISSVQRERVVVGEVRLQIMPQSPRWSYAQCRDKLCEHLDGRWSVRYGPHVMGWYAAEGRALVVM